MQRFRRRRRAPNSFSVSRDFLRRPVAGCALAALLVLSAPSAHAASAHAALGTAAIAPPGRCVLRAGSQGAQVRAVQRLLRVDADGDFGPITTRATQRFQRAHHLTVTGCIDEATRAALGLTRTSSTAKLTLSRDGLVALQRALGVTPDGVLGPITRAAIRRAQRHAGLPVDGVPSMQLLTRLGIRVTAGAPRGPAATMLRAALAKIGSPYGWGAVGPDRFDCSGLVVWAAKTAGLVLPRTSYMQYLSGTFVAPSAIAPGDLVFFNTSGPGASHVGIAVDATHTVSATSHGVREHDTFDAYWGAYYVGARRVG